jgi:hypothetical protein
VLKSVVKMGRMGLEKEGKEENLLMSLSITRRGVLRGNILLKLMQIP